MFYSVCLPQPCHYQSANSTYAVAQDLNLQPASCKNSVRRMHCVEHNSIDEEGLLLIAFESVEVHLIKEGQVQPNQSTL